MFVPYETKDNSGRRHNEAKQESAERRDKAHSVLLLCDRLKSRRDLYPYPKASSQPTVVSTNRNGEARPLR